MDKRLEDEVTYIILLWKGKLLFFLSNSNVSNFVKNNLRSVNFLLTFLTFKVS